MSFENQGTKLQRKKQKQQEEEELLELNLRHQTAKPRRQKQEEEKKEEKKKPLELNIRHQNITEVLKHQKKDLLLPNRRQKQRRHRCSLDESQLRKDRLCNSLDSIDFSVPLNQRRQLQEPKKLPWQQFSREHSLFEATDPSIASITTVSDGTESLLFMMERIPTKRESQSSSLPKPATGSHGRRKISILDDTIHLNVGGTIFTTFESALARESGSWLSKRLRLMALTDRNGRYFIDRDGELFVYILQYLETGEICLPKDFRQLEGLKKEANYYDLSTLFAILQSYDERAVAKQLTRDTNDKAVTRKPRKTDGGRGSYITLTVHANYNVRFRKEMDLAFKRVSSITVAGHVKTCRQVFGRTLSMSRDNNETDDRHSCRMFLTCLNEATNFNTLNLSGYELATSAESDAAATKNPTKKNTAEQNQRWIHVTNYYFRKRNK